jgi:hypothetical protein
LLHLDVPTETREAQLDGSDEFDADDGHGDLQRLSWEYGLSELADYCKIHGNCNVPQQYSENIKLGTWVNTQRSNYTLHREGKTAYMTTFRIQALESLGIEWDCHSAAWEGRLSELADYRKIYGHCNVPERYSEYPKLGTWVATQKKYYRLYQQGKISPITLSRIQQLESVGLEWGSHVTVWGDRLSELAVYHKIHGHCNVPYNYSKSIRLASWVKTQKVNYKLYREGKKSNTTTFQIKALESLGIEGDSRSAAWEGRLSQLADYRKLHGHCNVPKYQSWVSGS